MNRQRATGKESIPGSRMHRGGGGGRVLWREDGEYASWEEARMVGAEATERWQGSPSQAITTSLAHWKGSPTLCGAGYVIMQQSSTRGQFDHQDPSDTSHIHKRL